MPLDILVYLTILEFTLTIVVIMTIRNVKKEVMEKHLSPNSLARM